MQNWQSSHGTVGIIFQVRLMKGNKKLNKWFVKTPKETVSILSGCLDLPDVPVPGWYNPSLTLLCHCMDMPSYSFALISSWLHHLVSAAPPILLSYLFHWRAGVITLKAYPPRSPSPTLVFCLCGRFIQSPCSYPFCRPSSSATDVT